MLAKVIELMNWCCMNQITVPTLSDSNIVVCSTNTNVTSKIAYYQLGNLIDDYTGNEKASFPFISIKKLKNEQRYTETLSEVYYYVFGIACGNIYQKDPLLPRSILQSSLLIMLHASITNQS